MVTYVTPFPCPDPNAPPVLTLGPAGAPFIELINASAEDLAASGTLLVSDSNIGDKLAAAIVGTPTLTYSGGALPLRAGPFPLTDLSPLTSLSALTFGTATSNGGTLNLGWVYDPTAVNLDFMRQGETIVVQYAVAANDGHAQTAPQTLTFTILGTNDVPIIQSADPAFDVFGLLVESGAPLSTTGRVVFTDLDRADTPAATVVVSTGVVTASGGLTLTPAQEDAFRNGFSITNPDDGSWAYNISAADTEFLDVGHGVQIVYTVTVTDDFGASVTQDVTIDIIGTNAAPTLIIGPAAAPFVEEIDASAQDLPATTGALAISDSDSGDTLTAAVVGTPTLTYSSGPLPLGVDLSALTDTGALTFGSGISNGGLVGLGWTYDPTAVDLDFVREDETITIEYGVAGSDGHTQTAPQTVTFTIQGTNDAPVIESGDPAFDVTGALVESGATQTTTGRVVFSDLDRADTPAATVDVSTGVVTATGVALTPAQETIFRNGFAITNPDTGDWTYTLSALSQFLDTGDQVEIVYTVTVTDDFGASVTQDVTITIVGTNDGPVVLAPGAARVSEEGLPGAFPADLGANPLDTTDSPTASGTITAVELEGDALTFTLGEPPAPLTSDGQAITWTGAGTGTLTGSVGATPILTVTIDNTGNFDVTLQGPVDQPDPAVEDIITFDVPVNVSDGTTTTPTTLSVTVEDDAPQAAPVNESINTVDAQTNLMLILDTSGSMGDASGLTGLDRMAVLKASVDELLEQYGARGDVRVRIIDFDSDGNAIGTTWMTVAEAKEAVAALTSDGGTNYDAAIEEAMVAFGDPGALTGAGVENVSYFISDGDPSSTDDGLDAAEQGVWEAFLDANGIASFALGIPAISTDAFLLPIAYDGSGNVPDAETPIIVTDLSQLAVILNNTIPPFNGSIPGGGVIPIGAGADGGYGQSVTVEGVTYTFDPDANAGLGDITTSDGSTNFTYDGVTKTLTIDTAPGVDDGDFSMVMTTGAFTFQGAAGFTSGTFGYVIADDDGDTAGSTVTLTAIGPGSDRPPIVRDDRVLTNVIGDGAAIDIPSYAVLYNDEDADGNAITVTATALADGGTVTPAAGSPILNMTFTDDPGSNNGGSFQYTGSTATPAASDPGLVFVNRDQEGDNTLDGTGLDDILIGRDGNDNTIDAFEGDDVLIGGTGNDELNGGEGDDLAAGNGGDDTADGGDGTDTFRLAGAQADYTITLAGSTYTIVENATGDTDTASNFETFDFNGTVIDVTGDPNIIVTLAVPFTAAALAGPPAVTYALGRSDYQVKMSIAGSAYLVVDPATGASQPGDGSGAVQFTDGLFDSQSDSFRFNDLAHEMPNQEIVATGDFNGDQTTDLMLKNAQGALVSWLMEEGGVTQVLPMNHDMPGWDVVATGDFNNDGTADLMWQNAHGALGTWLMQNGAIGATFSMNHDMPGWEVVATGDFNNDGATDLMWQNSQGALGTWLMQNGIIGATLSMNHDMPGWEVVATGDFNNDGTGDLMWQNAHGALGTWLMQDGGIGATLAMNHDMPGWEVAATGDFNSDGTVDIMWSNGQGATGVWLMQNGAIGATLGFDTDGWTPVAQGDFDQNGYDDILWQSADGSVSTWLLA